MAELEQDSRHAAVQSRRRWLLLAVELVIVVGIFLLFAKVFHNKSCGTVFRCGCTWDWAGGWAKYCFLFVYLILTFFR